VAFSNQLTRVFDKFNFLPEGMRISAFSYAFGLKVPFKNTAGVKIDSLEELKAELSLKNKRKAQNHLAQIHASAMCLLAETASGLLVGWNLPDESLPLMKSMKLNFVKRSTGGMKAVATLDEEQLAKIRNEPKGEVVVKTILTDEKQIEPVICEMTWAWVPKKRK